jgi:cathepsin F/cysteine peptidase B
MAKYAMLVTLASAMEWEEYKQQFGKVYNSNDEDETRMAIFEANKQMWGAHESGAELGATQFSDMTLEEFQALPIRGFAASSNLGLPKLGLHEWNGEELAASVDWTAKGAVTQVKDQGQCGSCWAFLHHWWFGGCMGNRFRFTDKHV